MGGGLVLEYQRQLYEYWGPEAEDEYYEESGSEDEVVVEEDQGDDIVGEGRANGSLRRVAPLPQWRRKPSSLRQAGR